MRFHKCKIFLNDLEQINPAGDALSLNKVNDNFIGLEQEDDLPVDFVPRGLLTIY